MGLATIFLTPKLKNIMHPWGIIFDIKTVSESLSYVVSFAFGI